MEDDDMVLGSGSSGSGLTLGGDSGISLVDPHDSGLSLEEPLEIAGSKVESLELGEDDMLALAGSKKGPGSEREGRRRFPADPDGRRRRRRRIGKRLASHRARHRRRRRLDDDRQLARPLDGSDARRRPRLRSPSLDFGAGVALGPSPLGGPPLGASTAAMAESAAAARRRPSCPKCPTRRCKSPGSCAASIFLMLCGMMMYDMVRNIWSWDGTYSANSTLMDLILKWF